MDVAVAGRARRGLAVLVVSCPCALGIAIPLARVAGISIAGKKGLLVRDFKAFEQAERATAFVFDKTGTITMGKPAVADVVPIRRWSSTPEQIRSSRVSAGAMIAYAGCQRLLAGQSQELDFACRARWPLAELSPL